MSKKNEYSCPPRAVAAERMQMVSVLRRVRARAAPTCSQEPPQKMVCHQFSRCEGCPYPAHGFLCWGGADDCMRTRMKKLNRKGKPEHEDQSDLV